MTDKKTDWTGERVVSELKLAGWSLSRLSLHHGYTNRGTLSQALRRPWPKGERMIAAAIGVYASEIWPQRYAERLARSSNPIKT